MSIRDNYPIGPEGEAINRREAGNRENARRERLSASGDGLGYSRSPCFVNGRWVKYPLSHYHQREPGQ